MTLWYYEHGQKLLQKPVSQACPSNNSLTTHSAEAIFHWRWKKKTRKVKFLTTGIVGVELFCLHGYLRSRAQKGNKSARRVQRLCEGLTPSAQTSDVSDSNAGSCDIIKIYIASFGWRRSCTLKMSPGTDFHPYLQSRPSEMFPDIAECPP